MLEQRRRFLEQTAQYLLLGAAAVYFFLQQNYIMSLVFVVIAALNLQMALLWGLFFATFLFGIVCAILSILWVVPLQFLPVPQQPAAKGNSLHAVACSFVVGAVINTWYFADDFPIGFASALTLVSIVISFLIISGAFKIRAFIKEKVVSMLLLPALKVLRSPIMLPNGQPGCVEDYVQTIRSQCLTQTEFLDLEASDGALWTSVQIPNGAYVIDAAYLRHPDQTALPPAQQRWIMWYLGNGELFEFLLPELQVLCARAGINIFAFNYRGVGYSTGFPHSAEDLVQDGISCLNYLTSSLSARPEHVLLFGHSLGGAIAPLVRAESSPAGPIVSERSFCSLGAAAKSVLCSVLHSITGFTIPLPVSLVQGLLNSVFKGHLDVVAAWRATAGPKLIVYTMRDTIIPYKVSFSLYLYLSICIYISLLFLFIRLFPTAL